MKNKVSICWFRRDLRLEDNAALYHALKDEYPVVPVFIFDKIILDQLEEKEDPRVHFIHDQLVYLQAQLEELGSSFVVLHDSPEKAFRELMQKFDIQSVFTNTDYEPYATERDESMRVLFEKNDIRLHSYKDQVIFDKSEVLKDNGTPYTVFTPYSKKWKAALKPFHLKAYPTKKYFRNFVQSAPHRVPSLASIGFRKTAYQFPPKDASAELIRQYSDNRDFPGIRGTSRLGIHLRFGTISIRKLATKAQEHSASFLNELIWRDFYHMILSHFPQVGKGFSFKPAYDNIHWRQAEGEFEKWCKGETGYPIVDAGMRELNETGFMHNRVRMITASFLCKHLLIDWRWGEAYFAQKLLDYDLAANNGGWQWAAGSGCDAAPYFRIFNPYLQTKKFDVNLKYIRKWVPEFESLSYPAPMVNHEMARERCLKAYTKALKEK
ncbi:MAG: deoxyribodipyrimidine photo-lyase [Chitinophagaceae bacterium]|nr:MAG: deoxyribodipyrimidine photo-lyase [Chitinophagaceae bacterium]